MLTSQLGTISPPGGGLEVFSSFSQCLLLRTTAEAESTDEGLRTRTEIFSCPEASGVRLISTAGFQEEGEMKTPACSSGSWRTSWSSPHLSQYAESVCSSPVFPVFFMDVLLEDSMSKPSRVNS